MEVVLHISEDDLRSCIDKPGHIKRFQLALDGPLQKTAVETVEVDKWLAHTGLEEYKENFIRGGWDTLDMLPHMSDEEIKGCIEKPGHRKRFQLDLQNFYQNGTPEQNPNLYTDNVCIRKGLETVENWLKRFELEQYTTEFD